MYTSYSTIPPPPLQRDERHAREEYRVAPPPRRPHVEDDAVAPTRIGIDADLEDLIVRPRGRRARARRRRLREVVVVDGVHSRQPVEEGGRRPRGIDEGYRAAPVVVDGTQDQVRESPVSDVRVAHGDVLPDRAHRHVQ